MEYPLARYFIPPIYKLWLGKTTGFENVPTSGPFIVALNHLSSYDTLLMHILLIPHMRYTTPIHSLSNSRYWKNPLTSFFVRWGRSIPVYVGKNYDKNKNEQSISIALSYLKKGHVIQLFPEGTRSIDGAIQKGKTGVARLALQSGCPVLPVGIINSDKVIPKGAIFPRFKRAEVRIGPLIHFEKDKRPSNEKIESTTNKVMQAIASLIGQEYNH